MVVAGGGAGGAGKGAGGGGGGLLTSDNTAPIKVATEQSYPIVVGAGGSAAVYSPYVASGSGSNTQFASIIATGGGGTDDTIPSGAGGSGIVIIKFPATHNASFSGGVTAACDTISSPGNLIWSITATSTALENVTFSLV